MLPRPCLIPLCPHPAKSGGYCEEHTIVRSRVNRIYKDTREYRAIYGSARWKRIRQIVLSSHPLCVECWKHGRTEPSAEVDHVVGLADGGEPFDLDNLQALCKRCHARKTANEIRSRINRNES